MKKLAVTVVAALAAAAEAGGGAAPLKPVGLETLLSPAQYSGIAAAGDGRHFVWIENRMGIRNVWVTDGESAPVPITRFDTDDGQNISWVTPSADAGTIAFVRGGPLGPDGLAPDPLSSTRAPSVEIWCWRAGGVATRFGEGSSPRLSPDGATLAFLRGGKAFLAPACDPGKAAPLQLRGRASDLAWSPDGKALAFVSLRGSHSLVGVYSIEQETATWVAPGFWIDRRPVWSPDGARVAFVRTPPAPPVRGLEAQQIGPVQIWIADLRTGSAARVVEFESSSEDDARDLDEAAFTWADGERLIFSWERDGWLRLYAVSRRGGEPVPLSPPGCEARNPRVTPDGSRVVFTANCGDPDRSHVWMGRLDGDAPRALTTGRGIESSPAAGARSVVYLAATSALPGVPTALSLEPGARPRPLVHDALRAFPADRMIEPEAVTIRAADGVESRGQLFRSAGVRGRRPAVVFVHGGPSRQMLLGWHPMGYYHRAYALNQHLASRGYIVLSVNYRGGVGYGRAFRQNRDTWKPGDYEDVLAAARYLQQRDDVDPARLAIWGGSHGGFLSALALARNSDVFAAGVDLAGMTSFILDVSKWRSPVLVVHGDHDPTVPFAQSVDLVRRLSLLPRPPEVETLMIPDEQHMYLRHATWLSVFGRIAEFLDRRIGGGARGDRTLRAAVAE